MKNCVKISLFILIIFVFLLVNYVLAEDPVLALDFRLQDLQQDAVTLSSYRDKQSVLLLFWATWCPFCREELRALNDKYAGLVKDGLEVLAINVGELTDKVENFLKRYYLAYRVLLDKDTTVARSYEILGIPTYVLINKKGHIVFTGHYFPQKKYKELISE